MKVNLGCGTTHVLQDWVNIDGSLNARLAQYPWVRWGLYRIGILPESTYNVEWEEYIDDIRVQDVRGNLPFDDNSVEYIFSGHLIEHLSRQGAIELLRECERVLKPEGVVRISTPDLRIFVEEYLKGETMENCDNLELPADQLMQRLGLPVEQSRKTFFERILDITAYRMHNHKWLYDEQNLRQIFSLGGFADENIHRRTYQEGSVPDLDKLDNRENHSLFMEGIK